MHHKLTLALTLSGLSVAFAAPAFADPKPDAHERVEHAMKLYQEGKFPAALEELTGAYSLDPQPDLLYAIAQVHVKLEQCGDAITFYERFLSTNPKPGPAAAAHEAIDHCKATAPVPPKPVEPEVTPPQPPHAQPEPRPPAWYADPIGGALVGGGLVAGAVSIILYRGASKDLDSAETAATYQGSVDLVDSAHRGRTYAVVAGVAGVALVTAGILRYVLHRSVAHEIVGIVPTTDGGLLTWSGGF